MVAKILGSSSTDFVFSTPDSPDGTAKITVHGLPRLCEEVRVPPRSVLVDQWKKAYDLVRQITHSKVPPQQKADATADLANVCNGMFVDLFTAGNVRARTSSAEDLLQQCIVRHWKPNRPIRIEIKGWSGDLPWELLRVPGSISPLNRSCWLGEIAIIASRQRGDVSQKSELVSRGPPFVISLVGDEASARGGSTSGPRPLQFLAAERTYIENLSSHGRASYCFKPLDDKTREDARSELRRHFGRKDDYHVIHFACHGEPGHDGEEEFVAHIRSGFRLTKKDFAAQPNVVVAHPHFAFLNMCNGLVPSDSPAGGIASFFSRLRTFRTVVASGFQMDDQSASALTQGMLEKVLPASAGRGTPIGVALFEARNDMLQSQGSVTGFCYRLIGNPELRVVRL